MTNIEWTDETWNPTRGCKPVSPGCLNCYAQRQAIRQVNAGYAGLVQIGNRGPQWTGKGRFVETALDAPLRWRKPRRVFVDSMSDLFFEEFTNEQIAAVFAVMAVSPQHTFQVLTKRPKRMREWFAWAAEQDAGAGSKHPTNALWNAMTDGPGIDVHRPSCALHRDDGSGVWCDCDLGQDNEIGPELARTWPLPNVWIGVSVEDQKRADERIPELLATPAAVRFLSVEPLLEHVDLSRWLFPSGPEADSLPCAECGSTGCECEAGPVGLDWVIVGGESGPGARACDIGWVRSLVKQCGDAGVAAFVKQLGARPERHEVASAHREGKLPGGSFSMTVVEARFDGDLVLRDKKGGDPAEWPPDLRVRQFPEVRA